MQTSHTSGPWYTMGAGVYTGSAQNDNIAHIATTHLYGVPGDPMANARLIAAAPDLLENLRQLADLLESIGHDCTPAREVIARATGT